MEAIEEFLDTRNGDTYLKEKSYLQDYFTPISPTASGFEHIRRSLSYMTNFWWCIDDSSKPCYQSTGDWMAFVGDTNSAKVFKSIMKNLHKDVL
jgi:hypothetical protein